MLSGAKPLETRPHKWWPPGWYNLHIATTKTKHVNEISAAIIGQVLLGKVVNATDVDHEWKVESAGAYCYIIVASREFREPVQPVRGKQGLWYIRGDMLEAVRAASQDAVQRHFLILFSGLPDIRATPCQKNAMPRMSVPWASRLCPRKRRFDAGRPRPATS